MFATLARDRLDFVPALGAVGVNFDPLHQADLVVEVPAARVDEVIVLDLFVQTYGTLMFGLALLYDILELVIFILVLVGLRVDVGTGIWLD